MRILLFFTILFIGVINLNAQSGSFQYKKYFKNISKGQGALLTIEQFRSLRSEPELFQQLGIYTRSENPLIQQEAIRLLRQLGPEHPSARERKVAVHLLLEAARSKHSTIPGSAAAALQQFRPGDFDELARQLLVDRIQSHPAQLDKFLLTAGFLDLEAALESLRPEFKKRSAARRALNLALTRCGNEQKIESMMKHVREIPVDDEFVYQVVPMLVYTRQRPQMDLLLDIILSDRRACHPAGEHAHGHIRCGFRVIEQVAPVIEDFPVRVNETTGDLAVRDYEQAMEEVRDWIRKNRDSYVLKYDIF